MSKATGTVIDEGGLFLLLSIAVLGSAWFAPAMLTAEIARLTGRERRQAQR